MYQSIQATITDIRLYESWLKDVLTVSKAERISAYILEKKRMLRAFYSAQHDEFDLNTVRPYYGDPDTACAGDSCVLFVTISADRYDSCEEVIEDHEITLTPSPYDCTGREFTISITVKQKPNGDYYMRHVIGVDV